VTVLRVGVIGAGKHGVRYMSHLRSGDVPALRLEAFSRNDAERGVAQARELGCRFHPDWQELVSDPAVDAVIAVVPPTLHPAIVAAVTSAKKALLIEKPLATSGDAAVDIVRRVRAAGIPCLMAHTLRWNTVVRAVRDRLADVAPVHALVVNQRFEPSPLPWLDDPAVSGGGILLHTGVHSFDLVRFLTGHDVARVWCRTARVATTRTEDNFAAILELDGSPMLVGVNGCRSTAGRSGMIDVAGTDGQIVADHQQHWLQTVRGLERTPVPLPTAAATVREALASFARLLTDGSTPPTRIEDGAHAVRIAEACRRSADADGVGIPIGPLPR
jgi:predicted dehydrogenase